MLAFVFVLLLFQIALANELNTADNSGIRKHKTKLSAASSSSSDAKETDYSKEAEASNCEGDCNVQRGDPNQEAGQIEPLVGEVPPLPVYVDGTAENDSTTTLKGCKCLSKWEFRGEEWTG
eukprot:Filipodium_phascolosomae@DN2026_c0_g1_i2.p1